MDEIEAEGATALPNKEVMSLLNVNANVDLGLDLAAPVDLAVAANLNVAAPIEAAASANILSDNAQAVAALPAARHDRPGHQRQRRGDGAADTPTSTRPNDTVDAGDRRRRRPSRPRPATPTGAVGAVGATGAVEATRRRGRRGRRRDGRGRRVDDRRGAGRGRRRDRTAR